MRTLRLACLLSALSLAACGGSPPPAAHGAETSTSAHAHEGGHKDHAHGHALPPALKDLHGVLAPLWHAEKGPGRVDATCAKADVLRERSEATKDADLVRDAVALGEACKKEGRPEFEARFHAFHERFHVVMEASKPPSK